MTRELWGYDGRFWGYERVQIPKRQRERILERDGHVCKYCCGPATTVDHQYPVTSGGKNEDENLVACCQSCNSMKGCYWPSEFVPWWSLWA